MSILDLWHNKHVEAISKKKINQLELYLFNNANQSAPAGQPAPRGYGLQLIQSNSDFFEWKGIFNSYNFFDGSWESGINEVNSSRDLEKDWPNIFNSKRFQELIKEKKENSEGRITKIGESPESEDKVDGREFYLNLNGMGTYRGIRDAIESAEMIVSIDPTGQDVAKYVDWLAKSFIHNDFYSEDVEDVKNIMQLYNNLDKRGVLKGSDKNLTERFKSPQLIDSYLSENYPKHYKKTLGSPLEKRLEDINITKDDEESAPEASDGKLLYKDDQYDLFQPTTPKALGILGNGSKWCTRGDYDTNGTTAKHYLNRKSMFVLFKDGSPYAQWAFPDKLHNLGGEVEIMDTFDNPITFPGQFRSSVDTWVDADKKMSLMGKEIEPFVTDTAARDSVTSLAYIDHVRDSFGWDRQNNKTLFELPDKIWEAIGSDGDTLRKAYFADGIDGRQDAGLPGWQRPLPNDFKLKLEPYLVNYPNLWNINSNAIEQQAEEKTEHLAAQEAEEKRQQLIAPDEFFETL